MGLTLPEMRALVATDLKVTIGTELSVAQLTRAINRSVNEFSRYYPLEKVHEETLSFDITDESFTTPATADPDAIIISANGLLSGKVNGDTFTIAASARQVTPPRRLTVSKVDSDSTITKLTITVKGCDQDGHYVEENWYLQDLIVSGTAYQGKTYFTRVDSVILTLFDGGGSGDGILVGTGNAYDSYVFLAYKPIKPETEEVTNAAGTTTYTRDTDYTMDYTNGAIKFINGGSMAAGTAYLIDYTKSKLGLNISSILPAITKIIGVQYPADLVPQQFVSFNIMGDFMYIASKLAGQSQESLVVGEHLVIWYETEHLPPGEYSHGSYPSVFDNLIVLGAGAYSLLMLAQQYEQQAATDLASVRTELGLTTAIHTLANTALNAVSTYLINNTNEDAKFWLTKITTDIVGLRTAILTAVNAVATYMGEVKTISIDKVTTGAEAYLDTGDDSIDKLNTGARVAELYADFARARTDISNVRINAAAAYIQEADARLANLRTYIEQAAGWQGISETFIAEATQRLAEIQSHISEANQWAETVNGDLVLSDRFRVEGLERLSEFTNRLKEKSESRRRSSIPTRQPA